ncbi:hypothetical protein D7X55_06505 [Corallococcus sp. AB049A]|uniref:VMAP-C domain-containing protein n=1 Tax=Corallococcus sp. AB049A TaxID=2316721 RepID=UPI000EC64F99|nr:effector-associated domain EAD1-containing protein [Corallococcus sp. AB049A]RKI72899.1 hypothetical protein D7X55_06505 [Corallococcus sp. AB049A]
MELTGGQQKQLTDALLKAFPDQDAFEQFLMFRLDFDLLQEVPATGRMTMVFKTLRIAMSQNWVVRLLRQARRENPDNQELQTVEQELLPLFSIERLLELENLVQDAPFTTARLLNFAVQSAPSSWAFPPSPRSGPSPQEHFSELIDTLSSAPKQADDSHPLLVFVTHVAQDIGEPWAQKLSAWVAKNSAGMASSVPQATARQLSKLHLLVKCESSLRAMAEVEETVTVTAWIWAMGPNQEPVSRVPDRVLDPTVLAWSKVPDLLTQVRKSPKVTALLEQASDQMTVEICLRHDLLSTAVDGWRIKVGRSASVALGNQYPVVVRSFERNCEGDTEDYRDVLPGWSAKWKQLKQPMGSPAQSPVHWIGPGDIGDRLVNTLMRRHVLCVVVPRSCERDVIDLSIDAGAPAMLWLRKDGITLAEASQYLTPILEGPLSGLPDRVHQARQNASEDNPLGLHLSLLWDDFDRRPPDPTPFVAP